MVVLDEVYSPGWRRKKYAMTIMSEIAISSSSCDAMATRAIRCMTCTGTGLTRLGGGSLFEYARYWSRRQMSTLPSPVPQCRERLHNQSHGVLHRAGAYRGTTGTDPPSALLPCEGVEDGDWVAVRDK